MTELNDADLEQVAAGKVTLASVAWTTLATLVLKDAIP